MTRPVTPSRRTFLATATAAAAAPWIIPSKALGLGAVAPSDKITLGVIGIGPRATYDLKGLLAQPDLQCVAICDVQQSRRDAGKKLVDTHYGNADTKLYRDMRELLERKDIDAVLVATGDRWHAHGSMMAAKAGKHVYSEKPCGITIGLCQELADTMKSTGRTFQAGTQRRSVANFQHAVSLAHSGKLGKIHTLYAPVYVPSIDTQWLAGEPTPTKEICDWNMWLGPAPWRPYNQQYVNGKWRGYWDFDSGARLLDWGAHTVDLCQWANKSDDTMPLEYEPGPKGITCKYANGVKLVIEFLETPFGKRTGWVQSLGTCPVRFVGDEGSVETGDAGGIELSNAALTKEIPEAIKRVNGLDVTTHSRNWIDCIKSGKMPNANYEVMRRSHIACHAAALSWVLQRKLTIDPVKEAFINDDEANSLRNRPFRDPFKA